MPTRRSPGTETQRSFSSTNAIASVCSFASTLLIKPRSRIPLVGVLLKLKWGEWISRRTFSPGVNRIQSLTLRSAPPTLILMMSAWIGGRSSLERATWRGLLVRTCFRFSPSRCPHFSQTVLAASISKGGSSCGINAILSIASCCGHCPVA